MELGLKWKHKIGRLFRQSSFGTISLSLFWLVVVSGIFLAIPFDAGDPYLSVSSLVVGNPVALFIRNFHYWSSQFFLIFSLIHLYDHFHRKEKIGLKKGVAFRVSLGVLIVFLAMLTGFLLKGDADSQQARQILDTLIQRVPLIGKALAFSFLGGDGSYQLIYVHHIATFTVFIAIMTIEHSHKIWPAMGDFIFSSIVVAAISLLFTASLHDGLNPTVKGPWYFVGFQEILHWLSRPEWTLLLVLVILILIYLVNANKGRVVFLSKRTLLVITGIYLILTLIGLFFRGENWRWIFPWESGYRYSVAHNFKSSRVDILHEFERTEAENSSVVFGRKESCLICHTQTLGFTDSHRPEAIGCFSCHGGNPFATRKNQAHRQMILIPGNLATAKQSCGTTQCHPDIAERVPSGLMATLSGMISVDRFVFHEQNSPDSLTHVSKLGNTAADEHLKNLCVACHLGNPKTKYGSLDETSRGGGCLACHLNYSPEAEKVLPDVHTQIVKTHPSVSLNVSDNHCFGCHSRSGRISTNYEGWHETTLDPAEMPDTSHYRLIEGTRVFVKKPEDVHHQLGMECIDCHHSYELMGDGKHYAHEEDQQDVQCTDCHIKGEPKVIAANDLDNESAMIAALRFKNIQGRKFLTTQKQNHTLINTSVERDSVFMFFKNREKKMAMKPPAEVCTRTKAHANITCSACHSSWVPSCIGCHNQYDPHEPGYDMLANSDKAGSWVEYIGTFAAKLPALGVRKTENVNEIIPVAPGMVLTINKKSFTQNESDSLIFHRLYSPVAPHTTAAKGRGCKSCHNDPVALGFGEGRLNYEIKGGRGTWTFEAAYENSPQDGLPGDAWTGFLKKRQGAVSTRTNVFPFDPEQQKKILTVGSCLTCHGEDSKVMKQSLNNYDGLLKRLSPKCVLPVWSE
jgi:hypothetical protein